MSIFYHLCILMTLLPALATALPQAEGEAKMPWDPNEVHFLLYTRDNQEVPIEISYNFTLQELGSAGYVSTKKTFFLIHGFSSSGEFALQFLPDIFAKEDANVFAIDWAKLAAAINYFAAAERCLDVGTYVGGFAGKLTLETGLNATLIHAVGHSLGAHTGGYLGKEYLRVTGEKVGRVTGLDPARPYFEILDPHLRLHREDATFVDVIHVNSGSLVDVSNMRETQVVFSNAPQNFCKF